MKSFLVSIGLIAVYLCVVVYGVGVTPGNYQVPTINSTCTQLTTLAARASFRYVNSADLPGTFAGEPNGLTSGIEVTTTAIPSTVNGVVVPAGNADQVTFINFNTNPMGFGIMDQSFSATYTFYVSRRGAGTTSAPALQIFLDTAQPSGGPTDKTFIYEPYNDNDASKFTVNTWHRLTITYNSGNVWLRDTSSTRENCHWQDPPNANCNPALAFKECYDPTTTPNSPQCSAPFAGGPMLPPIAEFFDINSDYPVGKIYGNILRNARILGVGINLGSYNPDTIAIVSQMSLTTEIGTYGFTFPKTAGTAMELPCPAGPCEAPTPFLVSITPEPSSLFNGSTLAKGTDLSAELRLSFNSSSSQQSSNLNFKYQCLIDYRGDLLRYLGSNGACYSVDFINNNVMQGGTGSSVLCNFETPNVRFLSFNSTAGYAGSFRSTLRFNNFAGVVGTFVPLTVSCTPIADPTCAGNPAVITASTQVSLSRANTCTAGAGTDCSGTCAGDFTLERESDVKLRVTNQGDVFMCPDPRSGGQLINVCNLLNTLQG